jgi:hypothetical protein
MDCICVPRIPGTCLAKLRRKGILEPGPYEVANEKCAILIANWFTRLSYVGLCLTKETVVGTGRDMIG